MVAKRRLRGSEPLPGVVGAEPVEVLCPLCGRAIVPGPSADEHHLVPKSQGGRDKQLVHRICHRKIHATLSERELARDYPTWEALQAHPEIAAFIRWLQGKPLTLNDRSARPRRRR